MSMGPDQVEDPVALSNRFVVCLASMIANEFTEATSDLYLSALVEVGLLLFVVTVAVNGLARLLVWSVGGAVHEVRE